MPSKSNLKEIIDTIVSSKEFRRLECKTQLFSVDSGDHFRNRLTHTLEVMSIAKRITKELQDVIDESTNYKGNMIDEDLVEAIALAHDLGHTPFGHTGERTLNDILSIKDDLGGLIEKPTKDLERETFKHNINSGEILLKRFKNIDYRVVDGAIKHTNIFYDNYSNNGILRIIPLNDFQIDVKNATGIEGYNYWKVLYPFTIEGQIVAISDEIAQRCADLDDACRSKYLSKNIDLIKDVQLEKPSVSNNNQYETIIKKVKTVFINGLKESFKNILSNNKGLLFNGLVNSNIINYYGEVVTFKKEITKSKEDGAFAQYKNEVKNKYNGIISKKNESDLTSYDKAFKLDENLSDINKVILKSHKIREFDSKSKHIVRQLFKAFYNNHEQLGNNEIILFCEDINDYIAKMNEKGKYFIHEMNDEIKGELKDKELDEFSKLTPSFLNKDKTSVIFFKDLCEFKEILDSDVLKENKCIDYKKLNDFIKFIKLYHNKAHKCDKSKEHDKIGRCNKLFNIFLRHIANYIANMTDAYAIERYHELYGM